MTVTLDKILTARQQWALEYLSKVSPVALSQTTDEGFDMVVSYAKEFGISGFDKARNSLKRVLLQLADIRLVGVEKTWFSQTYYPDCGPSHCNEYHIESRGRRAAVSHDTY